MGEWVRGQSNRWLDGGWVDEYFKNYSIIHVRIYANIFKGVCW